MRSVFVKSQFDVQGFEEPLAFALPVDFKEAIAWGLARGVTLPEIYYNVLQEQMRSLAFTISGMTQVDQIAKALEALNKSLSDGLSLEDFKRLIKDVPEALALAPNRLETIFRTAVQTAYSVGRHEQIQRNKARRPYILFSAINDARTTAICRAFNGLIRHVDDPIWTHAHPPCHFGCRSTWITLSEAQAKRRSPPGKGLSQAAPTERPSPEWDYNKATGHLEAMERLSREKVAQLPLNLQAIAKTIKRRRAAERPMPVYPIPEFKSARSHKEAMAYTQKLIESKGPWEFLFPLGRRFLLSDEAKEGMAKVSHLTREQLNVFNKTLREMQIECDRLGIPRIRSVYTTGLDSAGGSMGEGALAINGEVERSTLTKSLLEKRIADLEGEWSYSLNTLNRRLSQYEDWIAFGQRTREELKDEMDGLKDVISVYGKLLDRLRRGEDPKKLYNESIVSRIKDWKPGDPLEDRPVSTSINPRAEDRMATLLWHEFGHHIHQNFRVNNADDFINPPLEALAKELFDKSSSIKPTKYADTNPVEFFAENYALWKTGRRAIVDPDLKSLFETLEEQARDWRGVY